MVKSYLKKEFPGPDCFTATFHLTFKEEITQVLHNVFQKTEEKGTPPNLFYEASTVVIPKLDKDSTRKLQISLINIATKVFNEILANQIQHIY